MASPGPAARAAVTAAAMASSLGLDVINACAAARAGLVRSTALDYFPVVSPDDGSVEHAIGHRLPLLTEGFEGEAHLVRLFQAGLQDLRQQAAHVSWDRARVAFYLSVAHPQRIHTAMELVADEEVRKSLFEKTQEAQEEAPAGNPVAKAFARAVELSAWPGPAEIRKLATSGNTGIAEVLAQAVADLQQNRVEVAVVGGVDSQLEEDMLWWLAHTGRLKTPSVATGRQPGEAAAFLVLEAEGGTSSSRSPVLARLADLRFSQESHSQLSGEPPVGDGLSQVIVEMAGAAGWADGAPFWVVADQNGEYYRAHEWGTALVRLVARSQRLADPKVWYPAISFGDTGAACGAVAACMVVRAFARGYSAGPTAAVISSAEGPPRAGFVLAAP